MLFLKTLLGKKIVAIRKIAASRAPFRKIVAPTSKIAASREQTCSSCSLSSPPLVLQLVRQGKVLELLSFPSGGENGLNFEN